jgi:hypothetical protein
VALVAFIAIAPSPLKKIENPSVALAAIQHKEMINKKVTPVKQVAAKKLPTKKFDPNNPHTWPTCRSTEWVWASDGKCHKKPAQKRSVAHISYPKSKTAIMAAAGIRSSEYGAVDYIVSHESGWNHLVRNNEGSGAYGLCQALPASKMASAGSDYLTNPVTQLRWCSSYAKDRYGGWWGAYNHWIASHWW